MTDENTGLPIDPAQPAAPPPDAPLEPVPVAPQGTPPGDSDNKMWIWIAVGVVALLLVLGGIYLATRNSTPPAASIEPTATVEPTNTAPAVTTVAVPNVVGLAEATAISTLEAAGFVPIAATVTTTTGVVGSVIAQLPGAGKQLTRGSQVGIEIAEAPEPAPPSTVKVPNVIGMTQANAEAALSGAGLAPAFVTQQNSVPAGQAFAQEPAGGTSAGAGSAVIVSISNGAAPKPATTPVPNVVGKTQSAAISALSSAGLKYRVLQEYNAATKGNVFQQAPPAGSQVAPGTEVAIAVSMGPAPVEPTDVAVPNVVGMTAAEAVQALADVGLEAQEVDVADPEATPGDVIGQAPKAGEKTPIGSTVLIGVARAVAVQLPY
jgi:beta-lactam-binding protein with PASTA domain